MQLCVVLFPEEMSQDRSWLTVKKLMANPTKFMESVISQISNFDEARFSAKQRKALAMNTFESPETVKAKSCAAASFARVIELLREYLQQVQ